MRSVVIVGVGAVALMSAQPAFADIEPGIGAPPVPATTSAVAPPAMPGPPPRPVMMTHAMPAPSAYVRPGYGYQLPKYWMAPNFYIADPRAVGLERPAAGFGWSRYYDDAVLTDQWGRVYDTRSNYDWDRRGSRGRGSHDGDAAVAGIGGAAVGAVAGNLIAGAGSRLAGSLIGGGVGALAGLAIEAATSKHRRDHRGYDAGDDGRDYGYDEGYYEHRRGAHWGGGYGYAMSCGCGDEVVTTTVTRTSWGGGGVMVPRQVVTYENVYAPVAAPSKMRAPDGKERRTTKTRPRVRGDY
jgi:hypothetical protein